MSIVFDPWRELVQALDGMGAAQWFQFLLTAA
jgi:hypothetical protein